MLNLQNDLFLSPAEIDILSAYRKRVWTLFGVICFVLFLPGSVFIFLNGYTSLSLAVLFMLSTIAINNEFVTRRHVTEFTMALFVAALMLVTGLSIIQREIFGVFWIYPAVLFINFVAFGRLARVYTTIYFAYISIILLWVLELPIAVRSMIGLLMTVLFTNIFLEIINKLQKRLVEQSTVDPLTGALNRRDMGSILQEAVERKRRTKTPASILMIDIDEFKSVNDTYGHAVGDKVLTELVGLLKGRARVLDRLFRVGGEEFMLYLPDTDGSRSNNFG